MALDKLRRHIAANRHRPVFRVIDDVWSFALERGRYPLPYKRRYVMRALRHGGLAGNVLFYPERPRVFHLPYKLCHMTGYRITNDPDLRFDGAIYWQDTTCRHPDATILALAGRGALINARCTNISKRAVETHFRAVFGYGLSIDPATHRGLAVKKSDINARHDGTIITCPIDAEAVDDQAVYQLLVNNHVSPKYVEDIRLPVFGDTIPFCYLKLRPGSDRFSNTNTHVTLAPVEAVLTADELGAVLRFCRGIGLDYGEVDALRDRGSGKLYIVDVNNTPSGPPNHLSREEYWLALDQLAAEFARLVRR